MVFLKNISSFDEIGIPGILTFELETTEIKHCKCYIHVFICHLEPGQVVKRARLSAFKDMEPFNSGTG